MSYKWATLEIIYMNQMVDGGISIDHRCYTKEKTFASQFIYTYIIYGVSIVSFSPIFCQLLPYKLVMAVLQTSVSIVIVIRRSYILKSAIIGS